MKMIANYFNVNLLELTQKKVDSSDATFYIHVEAKDKLNKVIDYFDKYPLMGVKSLDYQDFKTVYSLILSNSPGGGAAWGLCHRGPSAPGAKDHLTYLGREKSQEL